MESPPLWIWAVLVGAIILAKFTLRWSRLKQLARARKKVIAQDHSEKY
ncbi:MAG: hypothetical protein M3298_02100 [Thermoproteota archaeon]|nr:hypothetical protein [Thermoproteota archaeon]